MLHHIENEALFCAVDDFGAQLHSLKDRASRVEYLWQGDPAIWDGQAPVLFPFVGRLRDDTFRYRGRAYACPKHGFARNSQFRLAEHAGNRVSFLLESSEATRALYPFDFALTLTYALEGRGLLALARVENRSGEDMYFSIGGHPGFNCAMGDTLRFDEPETLQSEWIREDALLAGSAYAVLDNAADIVLHEHIFDKDALVLSGIRSRHISLVRDGRPCVKFDMGGAPVLGIWAKPGAPYVCIEPWYGLNDADEVTPDISRKRLIQRLAPGGMFEQRWGAEIL
jgi:galactose mutarotase-like enzyme